MTAIDSYKSYFAQFNNIYTDYDTDLDTLTLSIFIQQEKYTIICDFTLNNASKECYNMTPSDFKDKILNETIGVFNSINARKVLTQTPNL